MKQIDTILQIRLGEEYFGIDSDISNQILRVPVITSIPLTQQSLKGIVVLNGKIVPVIDLKMILNIGYVDETKDESRIITLDIDGEEVAVLVDEVTDALNLNQQNYEENISQDNLVLGFYKNNNDLIQIIEPNAIIKKDMIETFTPIEIEKLNEEDEKIERHIKTNRLLFFKSRDELFAVDIELVAELIFVPNDITPIAGGEKSNLGAITLREEVIDVFDFNLLFDFKKVDITQNSTRILILREEDKKLALCVESVEEIKDIDISKIENITYDSNSKIESLYKDNETIVSIVSSSYFKNLIDKYSVINSKSIENDNDRSSDMRELAVFAIDKEEFAFDIEVVQEIITYQNVTSLPDSDEYVEGVLNLRGSIIPVINLPNKLNFETKITDKSKIIVCNLENEKVGFLVDDVNDIMFIEDKFVAIAKRVETLTKSTISLDEGKRVILELRIDKIISVKDLQSMKKDND